MVKIFRRPGYPDLYKTRCVFSCLHNSIPLVALLAYVFYSRETNVGRRYCTAVKASKLDRNSIRVFVEWLRMIFELYSIVSKSNIGSWSVLHKFHASTLTMNGQHSLMVVWRACWRGYRIFHGKHEQCEKRKVRGKFHFTCDTRLEMSISFLMDYIGERLWSIII